MEKEELLRRLRRELDGEEELTDDEVRQRITQLLSGGAGETYLPLKERSALSRELFSAVRRLDLLQDLLEDPTVTEIMVNGPDAVFVERTGTVERLDLAFPSQELLMDIISRVAGACNRVINERSPIVDARLPDGSRVNAVVFPAALNGPILTIRRFPADPITMETLLRYGSITKEAADFLQEAVRAGYSMLIGGGTSAGKTTFLNVLSDAIPPWERVITIEDNAELQIRNVENLVRLEAKEANMDGAAEITIRDLIRSALRMRRARLVIGELRGAEALDMLQAYNTGHDGSLCTIHANSAQDMLSRLEMMALMALPLPLRAVRMQIAAGVDLLVHLGRVSHRSRCVLEISELDGMEDGELRLNRLFAWDDKEERLTRCGEWKHTQKLRRYRRRSGPITGSSL